MDKVGDGIAIFPVTTLTPFMSGSTLSGEITVGTVCADAGTDTTAARMASDAKPIREIINVMAFVATGILLKTA